MRGVLTFILIGLIILFVGGILWFYILYSAEPQSFKEINGILDNENISLIDENSSDSFPDGMLFYPNIRFPEKQITYFIKDNCPENRADDARKAFDFLTENTVLTFSETLGSGEISVGCSDERIEASEEHFIAGEGGPTLVVNTERHYVILNGTIFLYENNKCTQPVVAIHEILHVIGFKHSSIQTSIMYPTSSCSQKLSSDIIQTIELLYQDPSLPDLVIYSASATKLAMYLDFNITIRNLGLKQVENSSFMIYNQDEKIEEYDLGKLDIGAGKVISVKNLKIPYLLKEITFIVDGENKIAEIDELNNEKKLILNSN